MTGGITASNGVSAGYNSNTVSYFGRTSIGYVGHSDWGGVAHLDQTSQNNYALIQSSGGITFLNANSSAYMGFRIGNQDKMRLASDGDFGIGTTSPQENYMFINQVPLARIEVESDSTFAFFKAQSSSRGYGIGVNSSTFAIYDYNAAAYRWGR